MEACDGLHEGPGEGVTCVAREALAGHGSGIRVHEDLIGFASVWPSRHGIGEHETGAGMPGKKDKRIQIAAARNRPFARLEDLRNSPVLRLAFGWHVNRHQTGVQPGVDLASKCEDASSQADQDEDGASEEADIFMNREPERAADDET